MNLLRSDEAAMVKMHGLLGLGKTEAEKATLIAPLTVDKFRVVFGIVTHKDKSAKSGNLPLFSRISLMRCMKEFRRMGIDAEYCFIPDISPKTEGRKRRRKKKSEQEGDG